MVTKARDAAVALRDNPALLDDVLARLGERVSEGAVPTAAIAVGDAAGTIRSAAFSGGRRSVGPDSYFFLASVTKPIFATAFMQLVEDGLVSLDEPIGRWLPEFDSGEKALVTSRHLLTHTSGVPDAATEQLARKRPSAKQMTQITLDAPLNFTPGTRYEYCTATFYLLAEVIERLTGTHYRDFLRQRVLRPLHMHATFDPRRAGRPTVAVEGIGLDNRIVQYLMLRYLAGAALPGGGLFGTLEDMTRFGAALLSPKRLHDRDMPLSAHTFAVMGEDQLRGLTGIYDGEERPVHFGLGWGKPTLMHDLPGSPNVVSHGGASGTRLWIDPDAGLVFVYFTNRWAADRSVEVEALRGTYRAIAAG